MSPPIEPGQVIKGKYRIERVLGTGGMGFVVEAHHVALEQRFAIKFLLPAMLAHPEIVDRFAREARAASKLESDHVARVVDVDRLDDGTPFMVMEFLEGSDLSAVRRQKRPLPPHVAVGYIREACEALAEAHAVGIVHRDLKPANLFLAKRRDGKTRLKVLDFGISKMSGAGGSEASVTRTSVVMGSAEYMSPEQMMSAKDVDARADIWALGVTLFELLTATVPFPGETITHVCALVMTTTSGPPSALQASVPPGLDAVVLRCLERAREARFASARDLADALLPFASEQPQAGDRPSSAGPALSASGTAVLPPSDPLLRAARAANPRPASQPPGGAWPSAPSFPQARPPSDPYARPPSDPSARAPGPSSPMVQAQSSPMMQAHSSPMMQPQPSPGASGTAILPAGIATFGAAPNASQPTVVPFASATLAPLPARTSRAPLLGIGAALLVVVVVAGALALRSPSSSSSAAAAASPSAPSASPPPVASEPTPSAASVAAAPSAAEVGVTPVEAAPPVIDVADLPSSTSTAIATAAPRAAAAQQHAPPRATAPAQAPPPAKPKKKDVYGER